MPIGPTDFGLCPPKGGAEFLDVSFPKSFGKFLKDNLFGRLRDTVSVLEPLKEEQVSLWWRRNHFCLLGFLRGLGGFRFGDSFVYPIAEHLIQMPLFIAVEH